jgi:hypothetical protein
VARQVLDQAAAVDELHGLALHREPRPVVGDLVERRVRRLESRLPGGLADDPELRHARRAGAVDEREPRTLGEVGVAAAHVPVGLEQRRDDLGQDRRVGRVELGAHARQVDRRVEPLVEDVRVADPGGRVGVELEELDLVAREEGVEPADPHGSREAGVDPDQVVLEVRDGELLAQARVGRVGVAEAVEHGAERVHGVADVRAGPARRSAA